MDSQIEAAFRILYDEYMADRFTRPRDQETVSDFCGSVCFCKSVLCTDNIKMEGAS